MEPYRSIRKEDAPELEALHEACTEAICRIAGRLKTTIDITDGYGASPEDHCIVVVHQKAPLFDALSGAGGYVRVVNDVLFGIFPRKVFAEYLSENLYHEIGEAIAQGSEPNSIPYLVANGNDILTSVVSMVCHGGDA